MEMEQNKEIIERENINELVEKLCEYDVISFDIFDTLILRPFNNPTDLFKLLSPYYNMVNFGFIRKRAQANARKKMKEHCGHTEVKIRDIYLELNHQAYIPVEKGIRLEFELEKKFCYANSYMQEIYNKLIEKGKSIIIVSDMYLPKEYIEELLENCGYRNYKKLYVSCEYCATKKAGDLYDFVNHDFNGKKIIHIGDNQKSDIEMPIKYGIDTYYYERNAKIKSEIDSLKMSPTIESLYKGIIKNSLYNGVKSNLTENKYYRYGYIYSGILILGYVNWIHKYAKQNNIDKILFLSRDGYILKKVYDMLFDDIDSEYVLWSRHATLKTSPEKDIRRFIWQFFLRPLQKMGEDLTVREALEKMNIMFLKNELLMRNIRPDDIVNERVKTAIVELMEKNIDLIVENSKQIKEATKKYYSEKVGSNKNICIVDIGYRGSGAIALKELFEREWNFDCNVKTVIAYGFSRKEAFDDTFTLNDNVSSYVFSDINNVDLSQNFQKNQMINIAIIEVLISSAPCPSFLYFDFDEKGEIKYFFEEEEDYEITYQVQEGAIDFIKEYVKHCHGIEMLLNIPGKDAHEPLNMLFQRENREKFIQDFADIPYSVLVSGVDNTSVNTLGSTYKELIKEQQQNKKRKEIQKNEKSKKQKNNKFSTLNKIKKMYKRIKKIRRTDILKSRFYYTKYYEHDSIRDNMVLLQSYGGDNFSGNVYYILEELQNYKKYGNLKFYIGVKRNVYNNTKKFLKNKKFKNVKVLIIGSRKYCKILARAKYLINNVGFPTYFIKKEGQIYINTWHGTPLKGLGKAIKDAPHESGNYQRNFLMTDYFIQPNKYTYEHMMDDYMIKNLYRGQTLISGYPRNSIFYNQTQRERLRRKLGLANKKVIVYMPTWRRKSSKDREKNQYEVTENILKTLNSSVDEDTIIYVKLHNLVKEGICIDGLEKIKYFPEQYETYEFLNVADCLITDYSSVFFDFANTGRKIVLFAYDKEEYMNGRSMYFPIEELPFPIVYTENDLIYEVNNITKYTEYDDFKKEFCSKDSVDTTKKLCEYIFLNQKENFLPIYEDVKENNVLIYAGSLKPCNITENLFNILNCISNNNNNVFLNFYMKKIIKNRFYINEFSDKFNYITMQGEKNMLFKEGVCSTLHYRFGFKSKWIMKNIDNIYKREVKRLFPTIKFSTVIDAVAKSTQLLNLYKNVEADKKYIISFQKEFILNKKKKFKPFIEKNLKYFNEFYLVKDIDCNYERQKVTLKCTKETKENLFQINENEITIELENREIEQRSLI